MQFILVRTILTAIVFLVFSLFGLAAGAIQAFLFWSQHATSGTGNFRILDFLIHFQSFETLGMLISFGVSGCCSWWLLCRKDPPRTVLCGILAGVVWLPLWQLSDWMFPHGLSDQVDRGELLVQIFFWTAIGFYVSGFIYIPAGILAAKVCEKFFASSLLDRLADTAAERFQTKQSQADSTAEEPSHGQESNRLD